MPLEIITGQKGKPKLLLNGFTYRLTATLKNGNKSWECVRRRSLKCNARVYSKEENVVKLIEEHSHTELQHLCQVEIVRAKLRTIAKTTRETTINVLSEGTRGLHEAIVPHLPIMPNLSRTIRAIRQREIQHQLPANLDELNVPNELRVTATGNNFLLYDSGARPDRFLIFSTAQNLEILSNCEDWQMDGTFKTTPLLFDQLYTIHANFNGKVVPLVYALLKSKSRETYLKLFDELRALKNNLNPRTIMIDFEYAAMDAIQQQFPQVEVRGCFFHFQQSIWKKIQHIPIICERYKTDLDFALSIRRLAALAFRKPEDVRQAYGNLRHCVDFQADALQELISYFEYTWIGQPPRGNRRFWIQPLFSTLMWNVHNAVNFDHARTNNAVEGWHMRFQHVVGSQHPNIFKFIACLQKEEDLTRLEISQLLAGSSPQRPKPKYVRLNERLKQILLRYDDLTDLQFLNNIALNLSFNR